MPRPDLSRVPGFYHAYINQVDENDLAEAFRDQTSPVMHFFEQIPENKRDYRYAEGKWTISDVVQHLIDAERIFAYRALCFARKDVTPLPGFDENAYADHSKAGTRDWNNMIEEFKAVRKATELMFESFDEDQLESIGVSNEKSIYVRAIGFIIVGHVAHHVKVIKERYLN